MLTFMYMYDVSQYIVVMQKVGVPVVVVLGKLLVCVVVVPTRCASLSRPDSVHL